MKNDFLKPADYQKIVYDILLESDYPKDLLKTKYEQHKTQNPNFLDGLQKAVNAVLSDTWGFDITLPFRPPNNDFEKESDRDFDRLFQIGYWIKDLKENEQAATDQQINPTTLTIGKKLLILAYLQDSKIFPNITFGQTDTNVFLGALLSEKPGSFKNPAERIQKIKHGIRTPKQAESYIKILSDIKPYFDKIRLFEISQKIEIRINELNQIINR